MTYNLVEIQKRQESTDKFVQKVGNFMAYTSFPALDGILRKKKIWFGSATNVNDAKEVIGFIDNLKQNIENGLTQNNIKPKCDVDKIFKEIYDRTSQKHLFYVLFVTGIRRCSSMGPLCRSWTWCCNRIQYRSIAQPVILSWDDIANSIILRRPGIMNYTNYCLHIFPLEFWKDFPT